MFECLVKNLMSIPVALKSHYSIQLSRTTAFDVPKGILKRYPYIPSDPSVGLPLLNLYPDFTIYLRLKTHHSLRIWNQFIMCYRFSQVFPRFPYRFVQKTWVPGYLPVLLGSGWLGQWRGQESGCSPTLLKRTSESKACETCETWLYNTLYCHDIMLAILCLSLVLSLLFYWYHKSDNSNNHSNYYYH